MPRGGPGGSKVKLSEAMFGGGCNRTSEKAKKRELRFAVAAGLLLLLLCTGVRMDVIAVHRICQVVEVEAYSSTYVQ